MAGKLKPLDVEREVKPGKYADGDGLYLIVAGPTSKNWSYRYWFKGKERWHGLGSFKDVSLKEARLGRDNPGTPAFWTTAVRGHLTYQAVSSRRNRKVEIPWSTRHQGTPRVSAGRRGVGSIMLMQTIAWEGSQDLPWRTRAPSRVTWDIQV
jgi:hypothetical protein